MIEEKITLNDLRREVRSLKKTPLWYLPIKLYYVLMLFILFLEELEDGN